MIGIEGEAARGQPGLWRDADEVQKAIHEPALAQHDAPHDRGHRHRHADRDQEEDPVDARARELAHIEKGEPEGDRDLYRVDQKVEPKRDPERPPEHVIADQRLVVSEPGENRAAVNGRIEARDDRDRDRVEAENEQAEQGGREQRHEQALGTLPDHRRFSAVPRNGPGDRMGPLYCATRFIAAS